MFELKTPVPVVGFILFIVFAQADHQRPATTVPFAKGGVVTLRQQGGFGTDHSYELSVHVVAGHPPSAAVARPREVVEPTPAQTERALKLIRGAGLFDARGIGRDWRPQDYAFETLTVNDWERGVKVLVVTGNLEFSGGPRKELVDLLYGRINF